MLHGAKSMFSHTRTSAPALAVEAQRLQGPHNATVCGHRCKHGVSRCIRVQQRHKLCIGHHVPTLLQLDACAGRVIFIPYPP